MSESEQTAVRGAAVLGFWLALGLIIGGWVLGAEIKATRLSDRYVTVKGLVERTVKSDLAIWPLTYKEAGDDLPSVYARTEADKKIILDFLDQQGIKPPEIELGVVRVVDTQANEYGGVNRAPHRYIVEQPITVRTSRVDQVAAAAQKTIQLVQKGIVLNSNPGQGLTYKFTALNSIKPDMITEATRKCPCRCRTLRAGFGEQSRIDPAGQSGRVFDLAGGPGWRHRRRRRGQLRLRQQHHEDCEGRHLSAILPGQVIGLAFQVQASRALALQ
jgi:uncharacterized protein